MVDSSTKIWPIFRWANWGLSDDLFTGIQNSFYYSNLLEIREDAKSIYPRSLPAIAWDAISVSLWSNTEKPVAIVKEDWATRILVCVGKNVFGVDVENGTWTLLTTFGNDICDADTFNWYVYITTKGGLYMIEENANNTYIITKCC